MPNDNYVWNDDAMNILRDAWEGGKLSLAEIGKLFGVSKNAVAGKAKRMNLTPKADPVKVQGKVNNGRYRTTAPRYTKSDVAAPGMPAPIKITVETLRENIANPALRVRELRPVRECQWPGARQGRTWVMCCEPSLPGKPYCDAHCQIAYGVSKAVEATA